MAVTSLRMRVLPRYPARITGAAGLNVERAPGTPDLVVEPDFGSIAEILHIDTPESTFSWWWDANADSYGRISFENLLSNIQDVVIGENLTGLSEIVSGADKVPYFIDGDGNASAYTVSSYVRSVSGAADAAAYLTAIGAATEAQGALADSAVQPATLPTTAFAIPLGGGNQASVPVDIQTRFKYWASFEDFGIKLYSSGVTVQDNTSRLQEAIDKLQRFDGALFVPPNRDGSTVVETGPLVLRDGTVGGVNYDGCGVAFIGIGPGDRTGWQNGRFDLGQGLKLKAGSTGSLITSPPAAGHLTLENLLLSGGSQNQKGVNIQDKLTAGYGYGAFLTQVYINGFLQEGLFIGSNRGRGASEWLWVEYCGTAGSYAALAQNSFDWEHVGIGLGVNNGPALYCGAISQVRFFGGAMWMSETGAVISADCDNVDFFGVHFDTHKKNGVEINAYTGSAFRRGTRRFVGCRWSDNSDLTTNTYSDILLHTGVNDTYFSAPAFEGKLDATPNNKYCVATESGALFFCDAFPHDSSSKKPYQTAFIDDWSRLRIGGYDAVGMGVGNGGASALIFAAGSTVAEFRDTGVSIGGSHGAAALRAEKLSGGSYNRLLVQSTTNAFNFAQMVVESGGANADLCLVPKGTGTVGFGSKTSTGDVAVDGYIRVRDLTTGNVIRVATVAGS